MEPPTRNSPGGEPVEFSCHVRKADFVGLAILLLYRNWAVVGVSAMALLGPMGAALLIASDTFGQSTFEFGPKSLILPGVALLLPVAIAWQASQQYDSSDFLRHVLTYRLTTSGIEVVSETFFTQVRWTAVHKVVLLSRWALKHMSSSVCLPIPIFKLDALTRSNLLSLLPRDDAASTPRTVVRLARGVLVLVVFLTIWALVAPPR